MLRCVIAANRYMLAAAQKGVGRNHRGHTVVVPMARCACDAKPPALYFAARKRSSYRRKPDRVRVGIARKLAASDAPRGVCCAPEKVSSLLSVAEVKDIASKRDLVISVSELGPFYRVICRDGRNDAILAATNGWVDSVFRYMHCETLRVFTKGMRGEDGDRIRGGVLGLGILLGAATFAYAKQRSCTRAEILAIRDDDYQHARLVKYYKYFGFVPVKESAMQIADRRLAFTIVGGGRVGRAIAEMGDGDDVIIKRGQPIEGPPGPIIVCTRNDSLQGIVDATPAERRKDLVFIQNGMLQDFLAQNGLAENTQALIYFAVAKLGDKPIDGVTDTNPEGLTAAWGPHAEAFAARLRKGGLTCKVLERDAFFRSMLEKHIWICAFMLVGARHGGCTVGEVESKYRQEGAKADMSSLGRHCWDLHRAAEKGSAATMARALYTLHAACIHDQTTDHEVSDLITELAKAGEPVLGVTLEEGYVERLCAYARSVADFPTAVKEFSWRNGWFDNISKAALMHGTQDPCPKHTAFLSEL